MESICTTANMQKCNCLIIYSTDIVIWTLQKILYCSVSFADQMQILHSVYAMPSGRWKLKLKFSISCSAWCAQNGKLSFLHSVLYAKYLNLFLQGGPLKAERGKLRINASCKVCWSSGGLHLYQSIRRNNYVRQSTMTSGIISDVAQTYSILCSKNIDFSKSFSHYFCLKRRPGDK